MKDIDDSLAQKIYNDRKRINELQSKVNQSSNIHKTRILPGPEISEYANLKMRLNNSGEYYAQERIPDALQRVQIQTRAREAELLRETIARQAEANKTKKETRPISPSYSWSSKSPRSSRYTKFPSKSPKSLRSVVSPFSTLRSPYSQTSLHPSSPASSSTHISNSSTEPQFSTSSKSSRLSLSESDRKKTKTSKAKIGQNTSRFLSAFSNMSEIPEEEE